MSETFAFRAARYFGLHDAPRTSVYFHDGIARCCAVIPAERFGGKRTVCMYREYPARDGWVLKLTEKQYETFKAAVDGS